LFGQNRRGLAEAFELGDRVEISMGTLGKSLGSAGGFICGSRPLIDVLINRARSFIFSTAPPPAQTTPWTPPVNSPAPTAVTPVLSDPFVGNIVLGIYHVENCDWVDRISTKNRVGFATASEAVSHGFKPCRICSPRS